MDSAWRHLAVALVTFSLIVSTALGAISIAGTSRAGHNACVQINALRVAVTQVLDNSARGLPTNPYFKHRPAELRAAENQIHYDLSLFRPVSC